MIKVFSDPYRSTLAYNVLQQSKTVRNGSQCPTTHAQRSTRKGSLWPLWSTVILSSLQWSTVAHICPQRSTEARGVVIGRFISKYSDISESATIDIAANICPTIATAAAPMALGIREHCTTAATRREIHFCLDRRNPAIGAGAINCLEFITAASCFPLCLESVTGQPSIHPREKKTPSLPLRCWRYAARIRGRSVVKATLYPARMLLDSE